MKSGKSLRQLIGRLVEWLESENLQGELLREAKEVASEDYNGWVNYETWAVKLWLDNDEKTYRRVHSHAMACCKVAAKKGYPQQQGERPWTGQDSARLHFMQWLKEQHEQETPDLGASMYADLLGAAQQEICWMDIADNILGDMDEYKALAQ